MQKGAHFNIVCITLLIGLNIKFYQIFAKQHDIKISCFLNNLLITNSSETQKSHGLVIVCTSHIIDEIFLHTKKNPPFYFVNGRKVIYVT